MEPIAHTFAPGVTNGRPIAHKVVVTDEITKISVHAVFQARTTVVEPDMLMQMERRDRIILILLDGQRTIADVMHLLHRTEGEVARVLIRLLKDGYIDFMGIREA